MPQWKYHWLGNLRELRNFVIRHRSFAIRNPEYAYLQSKNAEAKSALAVRVRADMTDKKREPCRHEECDQRDKESNRDSNAAGCSVWFGMEQEEGGDKSEYQL